jgi:hypothetical protein
VNPLPGGGLEVVTPPMEGVAYRLIPTAIAAAIWGMLVYLEKSPFEVSTLIFAGSGTLFSCIAAWMWLGKRRVSFENGVGSMRYEVLQFGRNTTFPMNSISDVEYHSNWKVNDKKVWCVYVSTGNKRGHTLSTGLSLGEARWLCDVLQSYLQETGGTSVPHVDKKEISKT